MAPLRWTGVSITLDQRRPRRQRRLARDRGWGFFVLLGPSGIRKSTLLRAIAEIGTSRARQRRIEALPTCPIRLTTLALRWGGAQAQGTIAGPPAPAVDPDHSDLPWPKAGCESGAWVRYWNDCPS